MASYVGVLDAVNARLPDLDPLLAAMYAALTVVKADRVTSRDVHDVWALWQVISAPDHPYLVPFDELEPDVQLLDAPFRDALVAVARELRLDMPPGVPDDVAAKVEAARLAGCDIDWASSRMCEVGTKGCVVVHS